MNRKELVAAVHAGTDGLRGRMAANAAVDVMIKTIAVALIAGEDVEMVALSKFILLLDWCLRWKFRRRKFIGWCHHFQNVLEVCGEGAQT